MKFKASKKKLSKEMVEFDIEFPYIAWDDRRSSMVKIEPIMYSHIGMVSHFKVTKLTNHFYSTPSASVEKLRFNDIDLANKLESIFVNHDNMADEKEFELFKEQIIQNLFGSLK